MTDSQAGSKMATPGPNKTEVGRLAKFRETISDLCLPSQEATDSALLAWLRARDLNISKASKMLRESLRWRKDNNIETILEWEPPARFVNEFKYDINGRDRCGRPIIVIPFGEWDIKKVLESSERNVWLKYLDQLVAKVFHQMKESEGSEDVSQFVLIIDFAHFSMKQLTSLTSVSSIRKVVARFEDNHPETLNACFIINTSRMFSFLFALVKPLLSDRTLSKIQIFTSANEWQPVLFQKLPRDQLKRELGGTRGGRRVSVGALPYEDRGVKEGLDFVVAHIEPGHKLELAYNVKQENQIKIRWRFRTQEHDIGFYITYNHEEEVYPNVRYPADIEEEVGSFTCPKIGEYFVVFDNTYSQVRGKTLRYIVDAFDPAEDLTDHEDFYYFQFFQ